MQKCQKPGRGQIHFHSTVPYAFMYLPMHGDYVEAACIMFNTDTGNYLDAFNCPMRFVLHESIIRELLNVATALLLSRTDIEFYFRSQTTKIIHSLFFIYRALYL